MDLNLSSVGIFATIIHYALAIHKYTKVQDIIEGVGR